MTLMASSTRVQIKYSLQNISESMDSYASVYYRLPGQSTEKRTLIFQHARAKTNSTSILHSIHTLNIFFIMLYDLILTYVTQVCSEKHVKSILL